MTGSGIHIKPSHKGLLHKAMGVPEGKKLTMGDLMATKKRAKKTGNKKLEKQTVFAENAKSWNKGGGASRDSDSDYA